MFKRINKKTLLIKELVFDFVESPEADKPLLNSEPKVQMCDATEA